MVGFNLLREMIVLARAHNDAIPAKLLGGVESGVGGLPQIVTRQAVFRKVATPALMVTGRKGFTTGGTEEHGVWPRCERPSPRGARRSTGSGRAAKGFHHGGTEVHGVWLTWRRIQPAVVKVDFQYLQGRGETARMVVSFLRGPIVLARP